MYKKGCIFLLMVLAASYGVIVSSASRAIEPELPQIRTALVLGGGGARGAAHIGVLEVLERERIPIDCVVGTSMGALVAGSYAAGLSPKVMRKKLAEADWTDMFLDGADYSQLSYRKKNVTKRYLSGAEVGVTKKGLQLQSGVIAGEKIKLFFNQLVAADLGERDIEQLVIPTAIVATDIGTGERVVFRRGSLTQAMRASMSVPGLMAPVEYEGRKLVDGGLVDNLPIEVARELCQANRVIAVNVGSPLKPASEIGSLLSVSGQMIGILTQQNVERSLATLTEQDIYIYPDLGDIKATDFARYADSAAIGRKTAEQHLTQLRELSVSKTKYREWRARKKDKRESKIVIDHIEIVPLKHVHTEFVARQVRQQENTPLNRAQLEQDLIRIYGDGFYESVDYRIHNHNQKNILEIVAKEKNWSSDYVTFGFTIDSEYRQGSTFNLRSAYRNTWMNNYGGEFFAAADVGSKPSVEVSFYQPLDNRHKYFIEPAYYKGRETINLFVNDEKFAEYRLFTSYADIAVGRNMGIVGQAKLGWRDYHMKGEADISQLSLPNIDERYGGLLAELVLDKRNRLYFPSRGWSSEVNYFDSDDVGYKKISADVNVAYSLDDLVLAARSYYGTAIDGVLPFYDSVMLGGFLNMSGYASNQILADDVFYTHLRAERIIGRMPLGLNGDMRFGFGLEAANIGVNYTMTREEDWLNSAVIYLGGETPLGPAYLGYGFTLSGDFNLYFQIGAF